MIRRLACRKSIRPAHAGCVHESMTCRHPAACCALGCPMYHLISTRTQTTLAHPHRQRVFWTDIVLAQLAVPHRIQWSQLLPAHPAVLKHTPTRTHSSAGRCALAAAGAGQPDMLGRPTPAPARPGQESVWSYPRPAVAQPTSSTLRVEYNGKTIAETSKGFRTIETSHPPT